MMMMLMKTVTMAFRFSFSLYATSCSLNSFCRALLSICFLTYVYSEWIVFVSILSTHFQGVWISLTIIDLFLCYILLLYSFVILFCYILLLYSFVIVFVIVSC